MRRLVLHASTALVGLLGTACGDSADSMSAEAPGGGAWPSSDAGSNGSWAPDPSGEGDDTAEPPPPENERDFDLRTPEAGPRHLFVPSASLDALIAVDGRDLRVTLIPVGLMPTLVRALPPAAPPEEDDAVGPGGTRSSGALVLNEGSSDLTLVRYDAEAAEPVFSTRTFPVTPGANQLAVSPDGAWAFAWHDARRGSEGAFSLEVTLQDVTAVRLTPGDEATFNLAVGYQPSGIQFADDNRLALIACDDGLSVVDLASLSRDLFLPPIPTTHDVFTPLLERELVPTPDGSAVVVRDLQYAQLLLIDLETRSQRRLPLGDFPSDLDMTADGEQLLVPLRARSEVAIVDLPEAFLWSPADGETAADNPHVRHVPSGGPFGSLALSADGEAALVYTTQPGVSVIGLLDLASAEVTRLPLPKEVEGVALDPTGAVAALQLRAASGAGPIAGEEAYAVLDVASAYVKLVQTASPVTAFSFTADGAELFALLPDPLGARHEVHRVATATFAGRSYRVPDAPTFVGAMPQVSKMAISLDNPTGWITFVDTETDEVRHLNSFELNGFVR